MTDDKLNNLARALGFALAVIVMMLAFLGYAFGQHQHPDNALRGFNNRVGAFEILHLEPIETGHRLEGKASDKYEVRIESFEIAKTSEMDESIRRKPKGKYVFVVWCADDRFVYLVTEIKRENIVRK